MSGVRLGVAVAAGGGALVAGVGLAATSAWLISRAAGHPPVLSLMVAIVAVRAFGLGRAVLRYAERLVSHGAALSLLAGARVAAYGRIATLAPAGLRGGGDVAVAVDGVADRWLRGVLPLASAFLAAAAAVGLETWLLPPAGALLLVCLLAGGAGAPLVARWADGAAQRRAVASRTALSELTAETVRGAAELMAHGALPGRLAGLYALDAALGRAAVRSAWTAGLGTALTTASCGVAVLGALVLGVGSVPAVLLAVVVLVPLAAFEPMGALSEAGQRLLRAREEGRRLARVLGAPDPVAEPASPAAPGGTGLRISGASARWPGGPAVRLPDLEVPTGRRVAILGPSGSGKSTLAAVLLRFLPYEGSVTLGGTELRDLAADEVRARIGLCAQDAHLFDATVAANLRLARPGASDGELGAALTRAGLGHLSPEARVGAHGRAVSGGEHRRLALARLLLAERPVLVLDEPDAHLDEATADALLADLLAAAGGRTVLLVTHRAAFPGDHPVLRLVDEVVTLP